MVRSILCLAVILMTLSCKKQAIVYDDPTPEHQSLTIASKFVNEDRVINVWTPPNHKESNNPLPVLYMPDGGIKEDFPHIANTLDNLIRQNKIPPIILVGIENTQRGRDLTGESSVKKHEKYGIPMTDGAKNFRAFITDELMPQINAQYSTTGKKGIIGESLAGLFVVETFFLQPEAFDFYIAMDPSLWWNGNYLVNNTDQLLHDFASSHKKLWFAGSDTPDISTYTRQLQKILRDRKIDNLKWKYGDKPKEKHHTIFRATKEEAMIWTLNDN